MKFKLVIIFVNLLFYQTFGQDDSTKNWQLNLYLEGYFAADINNFSKGNRPEYLYSFHRRNELNLNLGLVQYTYDNDKFRGAIGIHMGTYASRNYGNEPAFLRLINQANAGIRLSKTKQLWLDAGVLESHIGFESAIGADCWTASRSLLADNSPYFNTGLQLSYQSANKKHEAAFLLVNGWQRIAWIQGNSLPSIGHRYTYLPNASWTINSSSQIGTDYSDAERSMRYFHNFYAIFENDNQGFTVGLDVGLEQEEKGAMRHNLWWGPIAVYQRNISKEFSIASRVEYFFDKAGVMIPLKDEQAFSNLGYSFNFDYTPHPKIIMRIEFRGFSNNSAYYSIKDGTAAQNYSVAGHLVYRY
jgi:hypothetical protein